MVICSKKKEDVIKDILKMQSGRDNAQRDERTEGTKGRKRKLLQENMVAQVQD